MRRALLLCRRVAGGETINGTNGATGSTAPQAPTRSRAGAATTSISGLGGNDVLDGGGDADRVFGGPGADKVFGANCQVGQLGRLCDNPGREVLRGGAGDDEIRANRCVVSFCSRQRFVSLNGSVYSGGPGRDRIIGADGRERIIGGPGADVLRGGLGRDTILAAGDGRRDLVRCGPGRDRARVDRIDRVRACERVGRR